MHRGIIVAAVAGLAVGGLAGAGLAQEDVFRGFGVWPSHVAQEKFSLELGITSVGRPGLPSRQRDDRRVALFPSHYGDLWQVTQSGADAVLWFREKDGTVRNAVLSDSLRTAWQVERTETFDRETKLK